MIRWSIQEIRRIANRLAQRRIHPTISSHGHAGDEPTKLLPDLPISNQKRHCNAKRLR